jgi:hypothetical protein
MRVLALMILALATSAALAQGQPIIPVFRAGECDYPLACRQLVQHSRAHRQ